MNEDQKLAFSMLSSGKLSQVEVHRETSSVRDAYGRHPFGQSLLLARRLVEGAGVPIVQANMGPVQNWDSHQAIFSTLKRRLLSPLDQAVAALLVILEFSGRLADTMVLLLGEFGRTPQNQQRGWSRSLGPMLHRTLCWSRSAGWEGHRTNRRHCRLS